MVELRWALLLAGLLLVAGLVIWERRKRRARAGDQGGGMSSGLSASASASAAAGVARGDREAEHEPAGREEPVFSMPDLPRREPLRDLPIVEVDPRGNGDPGMGDLPVFDMGQTNRGGSGGQLEDGARGRFERRIDERSGAEAAESPSGGEPAVHELADEPEAAVFAAREVSQADPVERASAWLADSIPAELPQKPVLDWPPEEQRRIVALRVVPRQGEKFNGAALRQALVGEGFIHGELDIYHKPAGDGRVVLSAASLTRPGTFDPRTIDGLLFGGLNLFAVLPGPLAPRDTVERLCLVGRTLAQRLRGEMLDSRGQPLTEARVAEMRREAADGAS
jgi:cell division protein ZipA